MDGEAVYRPEDYVPGFSDEHIVAHMRRTLAIVEEVDPPADLRGDVFNIVQAMCASMQKREPAVQVAPAMAIPQKRTRLG